MKYFQVIWQLPQSIIGLFYLLILWLTKQVLLVEAKHDVIFVKVKTMPFGDGVSLGHIIFYKRHFYTNHGVTTNIECKGFDRDIALHEYGHWLDGCLLGPAYLVIALLCMLYSAIFERKKEYRQRVFENWADGKAAEWNRKNKYSFLVNL